jgi:molybdopterin-guanine dinucleotide biosynthesis protein A
MLTISIQAGGQSQRMGQDKALVHLAGKPLIEHILERIQGLGDEILITTNNPNALAYLGIRLASDSTPGAGALVGLQTALSVAKGSHVLILACDMPFVSRPLLEYMIKLSHKADIVVPQRNDFLEPMHAIYSKGCLPFVNAALDQGHTKVISFYDQVRVRKLDGTEVARFDPCGMSLFNVNTPEDLAQATDHFLHHSNSQGL